VLLVLFPAAAEPFPTEIVNKSANTVPLAVGKVTLVTLFVFWPLETAPPMHQIGLPCSLVGAAVGPLESAAPFHQIIVEFAVVFAAVGE